jgi:transposase
VKTINFKALCRFKGYIITEFRCEESCVQVKLRFDERIPPKCPCCNNTLPKNKKSQNVARDLPILEAKITFITFPTIQGRCKSCDAFVTTRPDEMHPTKEATMRLMRSVSSWASVAPATQIAKRFGLTDSTVRNYDKAVLEMDTPEPKFDGIRAILVDEKSVLKNHHYVTVVINADSGELLHMHDGKKKESLDTFFKKLTLKQRSSIQAVGMDRAGSYKNSVEQYLPHADIVFDRFHLMMNINKAVDDVRRSEWNKASIDKKKVIKNSRYLLLSKKTKLDDSKLNRLATLIKVNEGICTAYLIKEQFGCVYEQVDEQHSKQRLNEWCQMALMSKLKPFERLGKSFLKGSKQITSYARHRITSGRIEGFNNLIARIVHRACGIRDLGYLYARLRYESVMLHV